MKLSALKAEIAEIAKNNKEALGEIKARLVKLQETIDELVAGNADPDVSDETFTATLNQLKADASELSNLVQPDEPPTDPEPPVEPPVPPTE